MKDFIPVVRLLMKEKRDVFYSIVFGFVAGIAAVGLFAASGYLISKAAFAPPLYALIVLTSTVKLLGFTRAISKYAERYFSHRATFTILSNLRVSFFEKLEPLAPKIFQRYRSGDLLARIVGDVESLQNFFLRVFYPPIVLIIVFLSTIIFTTFFSVYVAIVILIGLLLTTFVVPAWFAKRQAKIDSDVRDGRGSLSTEVTEFLHGFRDLKINQMLDEKGRKLDDSASRYLSEQKRESVNMIYSQSVNSFVTLFISWVVLLLGAFLVVNGQLEGIFLAMLVMISLTVFEDVSPMAVFPVYLQDTKTATRRLFSVVQEEASDDDADQVELAITRSPSIVMNDVNFTFPDEWRATLKNISLELPAGSKTAIVGPSGSGKSTLLQLMMKLIQANHGEVWIDGVCIDRVTEQSIWRETNVVLQENHFFYGTIRDNLLLARTDLCDEEMVKMLSTVRLEHLSLDDSLYEKGENLSGGEKQRLAIARALLKQGKLWLLDEPTSSVDALTEEFVYNNLFERAAKDTLVLVSHRLTGIEKMDQIIVMEQGTIIEAGTFDELMERKGYFYELKEIEKGLL
ncbi:thiol reductant ABC exporter subunit CydC [Ornithinibacillus salinisoli]|uniref:Thiol reductant ABC exporter subunit CydC n=1 Tax=Ornithinibacillus salinisoli TaxID=1848459 RepID=A0ABW4VYD4_9BACI